MGCVEGESAQTLVPLVTGPDDPPWFPLDGPEMLVTGRADHAMASDALAGFLDRASGGAVGGRRPLIYGWPSIVMRPRTSAGGGLPPRQITPLYVVRIEQTKVDGAWRLAPTHEPEFNLAALANRPENADTADEIGKLALPFGDSDGTAQTAAEAARLLGHTPPPLDPDHPERLDPSVAVQDGVYNAAVFLAGDFSHFRNLVHRELGELKGRDDWAGTAAEWLVGGTSTRRGSPSGPLAAALPVNRSQEEILASIRTKPLTVVTGPPGTGKTQLVVNAVANAWLDGETVLVASTNNAAVDVAVERADRDVLPGLLIRTGSRDIKQQVAQSISAARANARKFAGPPAGVAARTLAQICNRRSGQLARIASLGDLDQRLLDKVQERSEARRELVDATGALRKAGPMSTVEHEAVDLDEIRQRTRVATDDLMEAYERQRATGAFVPRTLRSSELKTSDDLDAEAVEIIREAAERLADSGPFRFFERKRLRERVGCPRDTSMHNIHEWASVWQEAAAERHRESEAIREKDEAARRIARARHELAAIFNTDTEPDLDELLAWIRLERRLAKVEEEFESLLKDRERAGQISPMPGTMVEEDQQWSCRSLLAVQSSVVERLATAKAKTLPAFSSLSTHSIPFGQAVEKALAVFQGWACTALSAGGSFPLKAGLFDLAIVDEASQCCLVDLLPLAYRAKRIVIAGDPNQLRAITVMGDAHLRQIALSTGHDEDDLRRRGLHHKDGSAYQAFECAAGTTPHLLDEHYRCHPHIAKWFNEAFYGGDLYVLTDTTESIGKRALVWRDAEGESRRPRGRGGWVNEAQARTTIDLLTEVMDQDLTIGVVAPYAAQGALIDHLARKKFDEDLLAERRFVSGTAHRLQGSERDTIIFSSTLTPNMPPNAANWIEQERNLINVAVSRARRLLVVVGHPDIDVQHSPTLASLRTHIVAVENAAASGQRKGPLHAHSQAEGLLAEAMDRQGMVPLAKLDVEGFELDFALMSGPARLNVEVDGDHHLDVRGRLRRSDVARDEILGSLGWRVLRIPAWRCHEAPDDAAKEIGLAYEQLSASSDG